MSEANASMMEIDNLSIIQDYVIEYEKEDTSKDKARRLPLTGNLSVNLLIFLVFIRIFFIFMFLTITYIIIF